MLYVAFYQACFFMVWFVMHNRYQQRRKIPFHVDWILLLAALTLVVLGLLMVTSASMVISDQQYNYPFHYLTRQLIFLSLGVGVAWVMTQIPSAWWQRLSGYLLILSLLALIMVLIPGIGRVVNGSRRWISLGFISLQVSEFAKLAAVIYLASYLDRRVNEVMTAFKGFLKPLVILGLFSILFLLEPDFGSTMVLSLTFLGVLFLARVPLSSFFLVFSVVALLAVVLVVMSPYRMARMTTFINPWQTQYGAGYQLTQSLIAFGRGGVFGVGLGNSVQKLFYLPEAHTDFLFAVIAEELGLMGQLLVLFLFSVLVVRMFILAQRALNACQLFLGYMAYGFGLWLTLQVLVNIGVNAGVLPTKGLTLPFISYGGSSILVNCIITGLMLRISHELSVKDWGRD